MSVPAGKAPILQSIREAVRLWRASAPRMAPLAIMAALAVVLLTVMAAGSIGGAMGGQLFLVFIATRVIVAVFYAAQTGEALDLPRTPGRRLTDGLRIFASMSIVGLFMFLVFIVATIPASGILSTAAGITEADMEIASTNPEAMMQVFDRMLTAQPMLTAFVVLALGAIWMLLTSRLYVAAPATAALGGLKTFDTWSWTQGNALRITAMRLLLIVPVFALLTWLPFAFAANLEGLANWVQLAVLIALQWAVIFFGSGLEACLSAYLYMGLKPQGAQRPA